MSPGVNQSVRIYIAQKRKISVGDKMAGRHGNKLSLIHIFPMIPAGQYTLLDFYEAGGIPVMMKELATILDLNGITCTGSVSYTHLLKTVPKGAVFFCAIQGNFFAFLEIYKYKV